MAKSSKKKQVFSYQTSVQSSIKTQLITILVLLVFGYIMATQAIETGSMFMYGLLFLSMYFIARCLIYLYKTVRKNDNEPTKARRAKRTTAAK